MDVLVKWKDGSVNCVDTNELKTVKNNANFEVGTYVKMRYKSKWYHGTIIATENDSKEENSSEDNEPLSKVVHKSVSSSKIIDTEVETSAIVGDERQLNGFIEEPKNFVDMNSNGIDVIENQLRQKENFESTVSSPPESIDDSSDEEPFANIELSDREDRTYVQTCEVPRCKAEVFSSCFRCSILLCWKHFSEDPPTCEKHRNSDNDSDDSTSNSIKKRPLKRELNKKIKKPEDFEVEGAPREYENVTIARVNKKKTAQKLRRSGKEYVSVDTKKTVKGRALGPSCDTDWCRKGGRQCGQFCEESRQAIFEDFYKLCDLQLQREYIARYVQQVPKKSSTTGKTDSRRQNTNFFFLPLEGSAVKVCRRLFINTLGISERTVRTVLAKCESTGVIKKDRRGGRCSADIVKDEANRKLIRDHINRFQRVESHYCRKDTTREYLHSDLTLRKMYTMFIEELGSNTDKPCFTSYRAVFKTMNLSFHRPKKDQCGLCKTYYEGSQETKLKLQDLFKEHTASKNAIRTIKHSSKDAAKNDPSLSCLCFDLQQVIYLPISNDGAIFYRRRFAVYNLTFYDIASRDCYCFMWNECDSGRGASEVSTALFKTLLKYDEKKVKSVDLFADGCGGQNRNSIVAGALLYIILQLKHVEEISLRFFTTNHGQCEGDSAHSAISYAIKKAGELFIPSQLIPVFRLARRAKPYEVHALGFSDFFDFKKFSEDLRVRSIRIDDEGKAFKWTEMVEFKVRKNFSGKIFFKTSHLGQNYRSLTLKRQNALELKKRLNNLNKGPRPISLEKYNDLIALCSGLTPVVKLPEHVHFYKSLPHNTTE